MATNLATVAAQQFPSPPEGEGPSNPTSQPSTFNPQQFWQHFDTLAETPDAVAKLRDLVFQLAVRGSLVPQRDNDEPGAELLRRILEEKRRLTRESVIKRTPVFEPITLDVCPFAVPANWTWAYLNDFGDWGSGSTPNRSNHEFYDGTIPWLKSGELNDGVVSESEEKITKLALENCSLRLNKPGDVLFAMYGATVGKVAILAIEATTNQAVCACTCFSGVFNRYLFVLLRAFKQQFISESAGAAQPNFSKDKIIRTMAPLPPLAEQRRIVAKVEELLALCDELEARQTTAREHRTLLIHSALNHLTSAQGTDFKKYSAFCLQHSELLFDSVPAVRKAILSLACEGRLVPQKAAETASGLLFKIQAQKKRLENEGVIRTPKPLPPIEKEELEHSIPDSWAWARLNDICELITDGTHLTPKYTDTGRIFLSAQNVKPFRFLPDKHRFVSEEAYQGYIKNRKPEFGDILLTRVGAGIGEAAVIDQRLDFAIYVSIALVRPAKGLIDPHYITLWLNSPHGTGKSRRFTYGVGMSQGNLNLGQIQRFVVPIPPLAEQQRIVAKVDELMRWCDALEARLAAALITATHLLDAILARICGEETPAPNGVASNPAWKNEVKSTV